MKKRILLIAAIALCFSILTGGTLAYFSALDVARNVITSGGVEIRLIEKHLVDGVLQDYPGEPIRVMPAASVSKIVSVENADEPVWVRMNYTMTFYDSEGEKMDVPAEELKKLVIIEPDSSSWTEKDGWWYYNEAVKTGKTTEPLFEEVRFSGPDMGNEYQRSTVVIDVNAQAVQQANNGSNVTEALGWPAN